MGAQSLIKAHAKPLPGSS